MSAVRKICLLGFGEVGGILADDLSALQRLELVAWDRQFEDPASAPSKLAAERPEIRLARAADEAATSCDLVISAVTAEQDLEAAISILPRLAGDAWFLDLNSVAPATKKAVADRVCDAGGRYVEAAIMSPIRPARIGSPILMGGPDAPEFVALARTLGFAGAEFCSLEIGHAAATKMCRSVVIKGMEALLTEAMLAARHYGVEGAVLDSLANLSPNGDWRAYAHYMISRSLTHGGRRSEEMREAAATVTQGGIEPLMSDATARRHDWASKFAAAIDHDELPAMLDSILAMNMLGTTAKRKPDRL